MPTREEYSQLVRQLRATRGNLVALTERAAALQQRLRADAPTIVSLDKLAQRRHAPVPMPARGGARSGERFEGEEASIGSDAWEISLINEEG
ncbi:MAG TPA: hypothetical protein VGF45_16500 [Polyangia bacterium]